MKNKKVAIVICISFLAICTFIIFFAIRQSNADITKLCNIVQNDDQTYSYSITDRNGKVIFSDSDFVKEPEIEQISPEVLKIFGQAGTGLSTNWAIFCDVENSNVSEIFHYVLTEKDNYVVFAQFDNNSYSLIVQDIFDKSSYFKTYNLENVSPVAADFVVNCKSDDKDKLVVTYLSGEDYTETDIALELP